MPKKTLSNKTLSRGTILVWKTRLPLSTVGDTQGADLSIYIYKYIHIYILTK